MISRDDSIDRKEYPVPMWAIIVMYLLGLIEWVIVGLLIYWTIVYFTQGFIPWTH